MNPLLFEISYARKQHTLTQKWLMRKGESAFMNAYETLTGWQFPRRDGTHEICEQTSMCVCSTFASLCVMGTGEGAYESLVTHSLGLSEYRLEVLHDDDTCDIGSCSFLPDSEVIQQATGLLKEFDGMDLSEEYVRHYIYVKLEIERV